MTEPTSNRSRITSGKKVLPPGNQPKFGRAPSRGRGFALLASFLLEWAVPFDWIVGKPATTPNWASPVTRWRVLSGRPVIQDTRPLHYRRLIHHGPRYGDNADVVFLAEALRSAGKFSGGGCSVQQLVNTLESKKIDCSENDGGGLLDHFQALVSRATLP